MRNIVFEGVEFRDTTIAPTGALDILNALKDGPGVHFDDDREIFPMIGGAFVVCYKSAESRDTDLSLYRETSALDGRDPSTQIPKICGVFEKDGRFGIILQSKARSKVTTPYAYEGVVVNPGKFAELVDSGIFAVIGSTKVRAKKLTEPAA